MQNYCVLKRVIGLIDVCSVISRTKYARRWTDTTSICDFILYTLCKELWKMALIFRNIRVTSFWERQTLRLVPHSTEVQSFSELWCIYHQPAVTVSSITLAKRGDFGSPRCNVEWVPDRKLNRHGWISSSVSPQILSSRKERDRRQEVLRDWLAKVRSAVS